MSIDFVLNAESRTETGTSSNRRLRSAGKVPAVVYGGDAVPKAVTLDHNQLLRYELEESFFSQILKLKTPDGDDQVILRELQRHPAKPSILHVDLMRVSMTETLKTTVPIHFLNEDQAPGVKIQGGVPQHRMSELEIECLPGDLPQYIDVDVSALEMGDSISLTDVKLPIGVVLHALANAENLSPEELDAVDATVVTIAPPARHEPEEGEAGIEEEGEAEVEEIQPPTE